MVVNSIIGKYRSVTSHIYTVHILFTYNVRILENHIDVSRAQVIRTLLIDFPRRHRDVMRRVQHPTYLEARLAAVQQGVDSRPRMAFSSVLSISFHAFHMGVTSDVIALT